MQYNGRIAHFVLVFLAFLVLSLASAAEEEPPHQLLIDDYQLFDQGEDSGIKASRKLIQPLKTYTLRTRSPSLWYRPVGWKPNDPSVSSDSIVVATSDDTSSSIATSRKSIGNTNSGVIVSQINESRLPDTSAGASTGASTSELPATTTEHVMHDEAWLMEAIEEVVQGGLLPFKEISRSAMMSNREDDGDDFIIDPSPDVNLDLEELRQAADTSTIGTTTPSPVGISSGPIWVFASRQPTTVKPTTTSALADIVLGQGSWTLTSVDQPQSTATSTVRSIPSSLITTRLMSHNKIVERSTPDDATSVETTTTEWWKVKPNYEFASLTVNDPVAVDYADGPQPQNQAEINGQKELPPPSGNPNFNQQQPAVNRPIIVQQWYQQPSPQSTPRRPVIVKAPPRATTSPPGGQQLVREPLPQRPPLLIVTPQPGATASVSIAVSASTTTTTSAPVPVASASTTTPTTTTTATTSTTTTTTTTTTPAPVATDSLNVVIVNLWNYVNGQLSLVGQQILPSQILSTLNGTNAISASASNLPASVLATLTGLIQTQSTTTQVPTTTTPSRPYGGVGNPTLLGVIQTVNGNGSSSPSQGYGVPKPTYGVPSIPSSSYGTPLQAPSQSYGTPPSAVYGIPQSSPSSSYGVPSSSYGVPSSSSVVGAPQSVIYGVIPPNPTMNMFGSDSQTPTGGASTSQQVPTRLTSSTSNLHFINVDSGNHKPQLPQHFVSADSFLPSLTNSKPTKQVASTKRPVAVPRPVRPVKPDQIIKKPIKGSNLNIISEKPNPSAPGAFVQGGNPLGALLPDFILESLARAQNGGETVPLGNLPRTPTEAAEAFASRLGGSSQESDAAGLDAKRTNEDAIPDEQTPNEAQPSHYSSLPQSIGRNKNGVAASGQDFMLDVSSTFNNGQDNNPVIAGRHPLGSSVTNNRLSAMELAYSNADDARKSFYPLDLSGGNRHYYLTQPTAAASVNVPVYKTNLGVGDSKEATTEETATKGTTTLQPVPIASTKADRRFGLPSFGSLPSIPSLRDLPSFRLPSSVMALAAVFPAAALSMPMLVGRKKREEPLHKVDSSLPPKGLNNDSEADAFVKHFTAENEYQLRQKDIAAASCRRMTYDRGTDPESIKSVDHLNLLLCPSDREPTVWNMILLDSKNEK